jgi:hypothetical protein
MMEKEGAFGSHPNQKVLLSIGFFGEEKMKVISRNYVDQDQEYVLIGFYGRWP